jgi:hypothetical protein
LAALDIHSFGMLGLLISSPCFKKMTDHDITKRYGISLVEVKKKTYRGFVDEPLIEEEIRKNLIINAMPICKRNTTIGVKGLSTSLMINYLSPIL